MSVYYDQGMPGFFSLNSREVFISKLGTSPHRWW